MSRYVSDTAAGKQISAYAILKAGKPVAIVRMHHSNSRTLVNIFHVNGAAEFQSGAAHGGGYDRTTAALAGLTIDGHKLCDHCEDRKQPPKGALGWPCKFKAPKGWSLANYSTESKLWGSLYRDAGLKYLEGRGYVVLQTI